MPDTSILTDLFDFDPALVASIEAGIASVRIEAGQARAHRRTARHELRRATSEKTLADLLPATIEPGDSWHVISRGDIDALSYLAHAIAGAGYFDRVMLSTWCMAKPDLDQLAAWLDAGRIDHLALYVGEIFPGGYPSEWAAALDLRERYGARLVVAKNHSKVICAGRDDPGYHLVMEGSANVNTNPRIEQTTITHDRGLYDFYTEFFNGLSSIDRRTAA